MNNKHKNKNSITLFLLVLVGIVTGNFISTGLSTFDNLQWIDYFYTFGLKTPLEIDFVIFNLQLLFSFTISIGSIFGVLLGIYIYKKLI